MATVVVTDWTAIATSTVYAPPTPTHTSTKTRGGTTWTTHTMAASTTPPGSDIPVSEAAVTVTASIPTTTKVVHMPASSFTSTVTSSSVSSTEPASAVPSSSNPPTSSTTPSAEPTEISDAGGDGLNGASIGAIVFSVVFLVAIGIVAFFFWRRRKRDEDQAKAEATGTELGSGHGFSQRPFMPDTEGKDTPPPSPALPPRVYDPTNNRSFDRQFSPPNPYDSQNIPYTLKGLPDTPPPIPARSALRPASSRGSLAPSFGARIRPMNRESQGESGWEEHRFGEVPSKRPDEYKNPEKEEYLGVKKENGDKRRISNVSSVYSQQSAESVRGSRIQSWAS